jgi:hypothetical protein
VSLIDDEFFPAHRVSKYFREVTPDNVYTWIKRSKPLVALRPGGKREVIKPGNGFDQCYTKKGASVWISKNRMAAWFAAGMGGDGNLV